MLLPDVFAGQLEGGQLNGPSGNHDIPDREILHFRREDLGGQLFGGIGLYVGAGAGADIEQAHFFKVAEGLAEGAAGDVELVAELAFGGNSLADRVMALGNKGDDLPDDFYMQ